MPLAAGRTLSHYEILAPLGVGGMGEIWRARDTKLGREVAIKVLPDELACSGEHMRRFEREARTLAALNHPNVAHVYGIDQFEDTCFIAMELVPGDDLETRLDRGRLRLEEAIDVGRQIAAGLEAAHEAGVVHRDLKPANVRRTPDGDVKVLDFGLAKEVSPSRDRASTFKTEEGRLLGTPTYMAPERLRGAPLDRRIDVWAFGCVLYECLTGERAFRGDTLSDVVAAVLGNAPDLDALPESTPPRLRELIERCLRKDPRRRLRDVGDARLELEELAARESEEKPVSTKSTALLALGVVAALLVAVATGALAARGFGGGGGAPTSPLASRCHSPPASSSTPRAASRRRSRYRRTDATSPSRPWTGTARDGSSCAARRTSGRGRCAGPRGRSFPSSRRTARSSATPATAGAASTG